MRTSYSLSGFWRGVIIATIFAGTLNILAAFLFDALFQGTPLGLLNGIAAAAWPALDIGEMANAVAGLIVHFAIMFAMVAVYFTLAARIRAINRHRWLSGAVYGLLLWCVMYWAVLPHRFPTMFPVLDPKEVAMQLFSHIILVGLPIAWVAHRARLWHEMEAW